MTTTRTHRKPSRSEERSKNLETTASLVLSHLDRAQRDVLTRRLGLHDGHPTPAAQVAADLGLTVIDVQRLERAALRRLKKVVTPDTAREMLAAC